MKVKREHVALLGVLLLIFGVEMVVIQSVVLKETLSKFLVERFYPEQQYAFMVKDSSGTLTVRPIRVPVPDTIGHCVATSGLVLLLCCFITVKPD
ncbi:MAG: hypothetical protein PHQ75_11930 [Thermoguttaceae bacterium]|nr:hypothetical protein [Thermoguttaceae bacterium]